MAENGDGAKILECSLCRLRYSEADILFGSYQLETYVCSHCYAAMQKQSYQTCCFGKPTEILPSGKKLYGYNALAPECRFKCADRRVCAKVITGGQAKYEPKSGA